jgi:aminoglycoside 2''-phosphotransferase
MPWRSSLAPTTGAGGDVRERAATAPAQGAAYVVGGLPWMRGMPIASHTPRAREGSWIKGSAAPMDIESFEEDVLRVAPELRGASFAPLGEGMDNRALLVADAFVFRFPKHPEAAERLLKEVALLPNLGPRLAIPIPRIEYVGHQSSSGCAFTGHRLIRGVPLPADLTGSARERAIRDIAGLLTSLRAIPIREARSWGVADEDPRAGYADDLARLRSDVYPLVEPSVRDYVERLFETYLADETLLDYEPGLLHADLAPDHIRYSTDEGRITGIIDWGDASIGDPDYELSYLYRAGGASFVEEVVRHGPRRDPATLERKLRFFAGHDTIDTLLTAMERGDAPLVAAGLAVLRQDAARS